MCKNCEKNPVYEFTNKRKLCKQCFVRYFHKKFLYTIRKFGMIKRDETIYFKSSGTLRDSVLEELLDYFSERTGIEIVKAKRKGCKLAVSDSLDVTSLAFIGQTFGKNKEDLLPVVKTRIKPLYLFLDKEVLIYAKILKLKFKKDKEKQDNLKIFVDGLEKNHPEVKRAIVNSYLELFSQ
tara:strand:+ start:391 stop:930 length:540 start_codon:yes stop_codon:yes gene_type:complete